MTGCPRTGPSIVVSNWFPVFCVLLTVLGSGVANPPSLTLRLKDTLIPETKAVGSKIATLEVTNDDSDLQVYCTDGCEFVNVSELIRKTEPNVYHYNIILAKKLDRDRSSERSFFVSFKAVNSKYPNGVKKDMTVYIKDENDESPELLNRPFKFNIKENHRINTVVYANIKANDLDQEDRGRLRFELTGSDTTFTIDPSTPSITLKKPLDFETTSFYQYIVTVHDIVGHKDSADVFITVDNVQDMPPYFIGAPYQKIIPENSKIGTPVVKLEAIDGDHGVDVSNTVSYVTIHGEGECPGIFIIDQDSGTISLQNSPDRDTGIIHDNNGICKIHVQAKEGNEHPQASASSKHTAETVVTVTFSDVDDNGPQFKFPNYLANVDENTAPRVPIIMDASDIEVFDLDQERNAYIDVEIKSYTEYFEVTPTRIPAKGTLLIRVKNSNILDYETRQNLIIFIEARGVVNKTLSSTAQVNLTINNVNDNSPQFINTPLQSSVKENEQIGTTVIRIQAKDADKNSGNNKFGTVGYSFRSASPKFQIDKDTGVVTVQGSLNREETAVYYLTVIAQDGGNTSTTEQLIISIEDVNDIPPHFLDNIYQANLDEMSTEFLRPVKVKAADGDEANTNNSRVIYSLGTTSPSGLTGHFRINTTSGEITVKNQLDYEKVSFLNGYEGSINLTVVAKDCGTPSLSSSVIVTIQLQDKNDNHPKCDRPVYSVSIPEDTKVSSSVQVITATDDDRTSPNNAVVFTIDDNSAIKFSINSTSGLLATRGALDRESVASYNVTILLNDLAFPSLSGSCYVTVEVTDVNDSPPEFKEKSKSVPCEENKTGLKILNPAIDQDLNAKLAYSIDWTMSTARRTGNSTDQGIGNTKPFKINENNGTISNTHCLDREKIESFTLIIQVQDLNSATGTQLGTATITITVLDVNDNSPEFSKGANFTATIAENMPKGSRISFQSLPYFIVTDKDKDKNAKFELKLTSYRNYFSVNPSTGTSSEMFYISVTNSSILDFESRDHLILKLIAKETETAKMLSSEAQITLYITNVNDNFPKFVQPPFKAQVFENVPRGTSVTTIVGKDDDLGVFGVVTYSLKDDSNTFVINKTTGEVFTNRKINREANQKYTVTVTVQDESRNYDTTQLTIDIDDVNDNAPEINPPLVKATIDENKKEFIPKLFVRATDKDAPNSKNSELSYELIDVQPNALYSNFSLNSTSGEITLNSPLDYEAMVPNTKGQIVLSVRVHDMGSPKLSSTATVSVVVSDINDNPPEFTKPLYTVSKLENMKRGSLLQRAEAIDKDGTLVNNQVSYRIDLLSATTFKIDSSTGAITLSSKLNREITKSYNITVTATDNGSPQKQSTCIVAFTVLDVNDEKPHFTKNFISVTQKENITFNYSCSATDGDLNSLLQYEIDWSKSNGRDGKQDTVDVAYLKKTFNMMQTNCLITSTDLLDREALSQVTLFIKVTDMNGTENIPQEDTATLDITIEDINDNPPQFNGNPNFTATIRENMKQGTEIKFTSPVEFKVQDLDGKVENSEFNVSLLTHTDTFFLNPSAGTGQQSFTISVLDNSALDYETNPVFTLHVLAVETRTVERFSSTTYITVLVTDENDHSPEFMNASFTSNISENATIGTYITTVKATDLDNGVYGEISYSLEDSSRHFKINSTSGCVFLSKEVNREETSSYSLTLIAEDGGHRTDTLRLTIMVDDVNDMTPVFDQSTLKRRNINEGAPKFNPDFKIQATDGDALNSANSELSYELINVQPNALYSNFSLNSTSGEITLNSPLDYEAMVPNTKGQIVLSVRVHDMGSPKLSSTATVSVVVSDINDNPPEFTKPLYRVSKLENMTRGSLLLQVNATDQDITTDNNYVSYSIDPLNARTFEIDPNNGAITLINKLDREETESYSIMVTATDNGVPPKQSTSTVTFTVLDVNDAGPQFSQEFISLSRNENEIFEYNCSATDGDVNSLLQYEIDWSKSTGRDGKQDTVDVTYLKNNIALEQETGQIISKKLDREALSHVTLVIKVTDKNGTENTPQEDTAMLDITIEDINDNPPEFNGNLNFTATIQENMKRGTEIKFTSPYEFNVQDLDEKGNNSKFNVSLLTCTDTFNVQPGDGMGQQSFTISVLNNSALDYETNRVFTLHVMAVETSTVESFSSTAYITVSVTDENDNSPKFVKPSFESNISENATIGTDVTTVKATDLDDGVYGEISYSLEDSSGHFSINETSGVVFLTKELNRESKGSYSLPLTAIDGGYRTNITQLTITVDDVNDITPVFKESALKDRTVNEGETEFNPDFFILATDGDDEGPNSEVQYQLIETEPKESFSSFNLNKTTGELTLSSPLDYENLTSSNGVITLRILAHDMGSPQLSVNTTVRLAVIDQNDVAPEFEHSYYQSAVLENATEGTYISTVAASDEDGTSPSNKLYYVIQSGGQDKFQINSSTGNISVGVGAHLNREAVPKYTLVVLAIDKGIPALTATVSVDMTIRDVNDEEPVFTDSSVNIQVYENAPVGSGIGTISASDSDIDFQLIYTLLWSDSQAFDERDGNVNIAHVQHWLSLNHSTGELVINSSLDRELAEQLVLKVKVEDINAVGDAQTAKATITVNILDINDNAPKIKGSNNLSFHVSEATKTGTEVTTLTATDADKAQTIIFSLQDKDSYFSITPTGKLTVKKPLDRETKEFIKFSIIVTDSGNPPMSSCVAANVTVLDSNDNDPEFIGNITTFNVEENADTETLVTKLNATDADAGGNANVTFRLKYYTPLFRINPLQGEIYVSGNLDRETQPEHTLSVIAVDNPTQGDPRRQSVTVLKIIVTDVNDNAPLFERGIDQTGYTANVEETRKPGIPITVQPRAILAKDKDEGNNANVSYSLVNSTNDFFSITHDSGLLYVTTNRSIQDQTGEYRYIVQASDHGDPKMSTFANLTIKILDENIHAPEFINLPQSIPVPECTEVHKTLFTFEGKDQDSDKDTNGAVRFLLDTHAATDHWKYFKLSEVGILTLEKRLDSETLRNLSIQVIIHDLGLPQQLSNRSGAVHIIIEDVNDNPPYFNDIKTNFTVSENCPEGTSVGQVTATDADQGSILKYSIDSQGEPWADSFIINEMSGEITVKKPLDRETVTLIKLQIMVKDVQQKAMNELCSNNSNGNSIDDSDTITVSVEVQDENDHPPVFTEKTLSKGFLSDTEFGKPILQLPPFVTDKDTAANSIHQFFQLGELKADSYLSKKWNSKIKADPIIVARNGTIFTNYLFNDDAFGYFTFKVLANDTAGSDNITLKIYVVGHSQVIHMTLYYPEETVRTLQQDITKRLSNLGYEFVPDNILTSRGADGLVDGSKSVLVLHAVDKDGNIVAGSDLVRKVDADPKVGRILNEKFKVLRIETGSDVDKKAVVLNDNRTQYILIAIIVIIVITFLITLYALIYNIRRFKRKLKAATIETHGLEPVGEMVPGKDPHGYNGSNPIYMVDGIGFEDTNCDDARSYDSHSISQSSQNSLDANEVDTLDKRDCKPASELLDEQEVTLNMYGQEDTVDNDASDLPEALHDFDFAFHSEEHTYQSMRENEEAEEPEVVTHRRLYRIGHYSKAVHNDGFDGNESNYADLDFSVEELEATEI